MFSDNSLGAYLYLQERARNQTDSYTMERLDRALDEISRNPQRHDPVPFQTRSALANAGKVLKQRRALVPVASLEAMTEDTSDSALRSPDQESILTNVETVTWLVCSLGITEIQRSLLLALAQGTDPESLAARHGVPAARMRERIARARAAARRAYATEVLHEAAPRPAPVSNAVPA